MGILSWIVMGLIVGVLAKFIMPGRDPGGFVITVALGIGGAPGERYRFSARYSASSTIAPSVAMKMLATLNPLTVPMPRNEPM
jgi:uncharacterized membrane protein YeaQ/YmgE (transglycosylase-associated protein family)